MLTRILLVAAAVLQVSATEALANSNQTQAQDKLKSFTIPHPRRQGGFKERKVQKNLADSQPETVSNKMMLKNNNDQLYSGPMFFGSPQQGSLKSVFIYDTTSSMTSVTNVTCATCSTHYYNSTTSSSAVHNNDTFVNTTNLYYQHGDLTVNGSVWNDVACLNATDAWSCTNSSFPIFVVDNMQGTPESNKKFASVDGVVGFGPPTGNQTHAGNNETSYILALWQQRKISEPIMAMNLNYDDSSTSYIVIGSRPFANSGKQFSYKVDTTKYDKWTLELTKMRYGDSVPMAIPADQTAVLDSSYGYIGLPQKDYETFVLNVSKVSGVQCNTGVPDMGIRCLSTSRKCSELQDELQPINLFFGKQQYTIPAKGYTIVDPAQDILCEIGIDQKDYPVDAVSTPIVLGDTFLRNFRTTYDYNTVAVTLSVNPVNHSSININGLSSHGLTGIITGSIVLFVIIGITMCCLLCGKCKTKSAVTRNWESQEGDDEENMHQDDVILLDGNLDDKQDE